MAKNSKAEFVASLERGLRVLQTFSREHPQLTLSEVATLTGLTPATARRSLHTLEELGYVGRTGRRFLLRPKVLAIGTGYLSAINAEVVLQPFLQDVVNEVGGSSSVTVLDDDRHRLHRARVPEPRDPADGRCRLALPGVPDVDGPRAARVSAGVGDRRVLRARDAAAS